MISYRWVVAPLAVAAVAAVGACASGHGLQGSAAEALYARYSGTWALDTETSDPVPTFAARGGPGDSDDVRSGGPPAGGGGGMGGGAMGGGRRGGGGPPGGGGPGAGSDVTPEGMQATNRMSLQRPARLELVLNDSIFDYGAEGTSRVTVPASGDEVALESGGTPYDARLRWDDGKPVLERSVEGGGEVTDVFEALTPDRLLVTRSFEMGPGRDVEVRLLFDRVSGA